MKKIMTGTTLMAFAFSFFVQMPVNAQQGDVLDKVNLFIGTANEDRGVTICIDIPIATAGDGSNDRLFGA